jgi:stage III sporulation protein AH
MNAKRQTIWLVSMLSLMVVLSAYYLFTEDVNKLNLANTDAAKNPTEIKVDMSQTDKPTTANSSKTDPTATGTQTKTDPTATGAQTKTNPTAAGTQTKADPTATGAQTKTDSKTTAADASKTTKTDATADADVLKKMQAQATSAENYFTTEQMKRHDELSKKTEQLMLTITDPKQKPEAVAQATNDLDKISETQDKITSIEELLMKDYDQAIVSQEGNKWKVTLQSEKLEKSQGVSIVDLVMKELGAAPENIKIQYVHP